MVPYFCVREEGAVGMSYQAAKSGTARVLTIASTSRSCSRKVLSSRLEGSGKVICIRRTSPALR